MAIDTIKSSAITDGTIATGDIADDAVTGVKLANDINIAGDLTVTGNDINTAGSMLLRPAGTEIVNINNTGDVIVKGQGSNRGMLVLRAGSNTANSQLRFGDQATDVAGRIMYDHASNFMRFDTNENERLRIDSAGHITSSSQSSAQSRPAASITDVTGAASTYYSDQGNGGSGTTTYTDVFDQNADFSNGTFTAPVTGKYLVCINVEFTEVASNHSSGVFYIITSNRSYQRLFQPRNMSNVGVNIGLPMSQIVDADANDVIRWAMYIAGGSKQVNITTNTNFGVHLLS